MSSKSDLKPIVVYGSGGPNPPKIPVLLEELGVPYTINDVQFSQVKEPQYVAINPNGRLPAIHDPNSDLTLWESGAILEYLIDTYDTDHKLSFAKGSRESFLTKQWLFYQVSGQGPYYGQIFYFKRYHHEQLPSAIARFAKEANRVTGVLEAWLTKQQDEFKGKGDGPWLVGNKLTYADLAFLPWQIALSKATTKDEYDAEKYPAVKAWFDKMVQRESVQKILAPLLKM